MGRQTAAEDLLQASSRRYANGVSIVTSNRPIEDFRVVIGDNVEYSQELWIGP